MGRRRVWTRSCNLGMSFEGEGSSHKRGWDVRQLGARENALFVNLNRVGIPKRGEASQELIYQDP